jgi:hypothetical protein
VRHPTTVKQAFPAVRTINSEGDADEKLYVIVSA